MSESSVSKRKRYVDHPRDRSKIKCPIHGPGYYSEKYKVLGDFYSKYSKIRSTKDSNHEATRKNKFGRHKEKKYIVQHAVDDNTPQDNNKSKCKK